jgi:hypothetical protein
VSNVAGWRDAALASNYPFGDDCPLIEKEGVFLVPADLFVDARLLAPADAGAVWLGSLRLNGSGVSGEIFAGTESLGSFHVSAPGGSATVRDLNGVQRGLLVFGDSLALPEAVMLFDASAAVFSPGTVFRHPRPVLRSLTISDPDGSFGTLTGRIALAAGRGVELTSEGDQTIRIDAVGAPDDAADCFGPLGDPIRSINGRPLSEAGDFRFDPDQYAEPADPETPRQILRITEGEHSLTFGLAR